MTTKLSVPWIVPLTGGNVPVDAYPQQQPFKVDAVFAERVASVEPNHGRRQFPDGGLGRAIRPIKGDAEFEGLNEERVAAFLSIDDGDERQLKKSAIATATLCLAMIHPHDRKKPLDANIVCIPTPSM